MNITITGKPGSGKSSIAAELEKLGWRRVSAGSIFRARAAERGMTVQELGRAMDEDPELFEKINGEIDGETEHLNRTLDHVVFDARAGFAVCRGALRVLVECDEHERARRVYESKRGGEKYASVGEAELGLRERADFEQREFLELFGQDPFSPDMHDIVVDNSND